MIATNGNTGALRRGAFRVTRILKTSLMVAVYATCTNLGLVRAWARRTLGGEDIIPLLSEGAQARQLAISRRQVAEHADTERNA